MDQNKKGKGFFARLGGILPLSLATALGGPATAGMLMAAVGGVAFGVPAALIAVKTISEGMPKVPKGKLADRAFGGYSGAMDSVLPADAMRALTTDEEEDHPDDETSLGMLIPEKLPEDKDAKEKPAKERGEKTIPTVQAIGDNVPSKKALEEARKAFAGQGLSGSTAGGSGGSGGGAMTGASSGNSNLVKGAVSSVGGGGLSSRAGGTGRAQKAGVRRIGAVRTGKGAGSKGLKGAAQLASKGYGMDQTAAGYTGAAMGEAPKTAAILSGAGTSVSGGLSDSGGLPEMDVPAPGHGQGLAVPPPDSPKNEDPDGESLDMTLVLGIILALGVGLGAAALCAAMANTFMGWTVAIATLALLMDIWSGFPGILKGLMGGKKGFDLFGQGALGVIIGGILFAATLYLGAMIIQAVTTGAFDFNVFDWGAGKSGTAAPAAAGGAKPSITTGGPKGGGVKTPSITPEKL
ncbi:MAG: hypothetical protein AABZ44_05050 [Elusimicrobiota bacterium]